MQVMSLPYLLQSLVSTKTATCVQPQLGGVVHHYPSHCSVDRSSTATNNSGRMERQCQMMPVAVKHGRYSTGAAPPVQIKKEIKTEEGKEQLLIATYTHSHSFSSMLAWMHSAYYYTDID